MDDAHAALPDQTLGLPTLVKARLRYVDDLNWFEPTDLHFIESIPRGTRDPIHVFQYTPTGRHLFLDHRGRSYRFVPANDPSKEGSFRLHNGHASGIERLRPELHPETPSEPFDFPWSDPYEPSPWDEFGYEPGLHILPNTPDYLRSTTCYGPLMRREITQRELRNQSGEIMRGLDNGDEFVVTRNGVAVGELLPLRRKRFVATDALMEQFRGAPAVDYEQLRADLDAVSDQDPTPRG